MNVNYRDSSNKAGQTGLSEPDEAELLRSMSALSSKDAFVLLQTELLRAGLRGVTYRAVRARIWKQRFGARVAQ
jgi:hypothetical protein